MAPEALAGGRSSRSETTTRLMLVGPMSRPQGRFRPMERGGSGGARWALRERQGVLVSAQREGAGVLWQRGLASRRVQFCFHSDQCLAVECARQGSQHFSF